MHRPLVPLALRSFAWCVCAFGGLAQSCTPPLDEPGTSMDSSVLLDDQQLVTPLICPGARHCEDADGDFRAGASSRVVTPTMDQPIWLAGFGQGRAATAIHDDVWVRTLVLERGATRVALVAIDAVGWFHDDALHIKKAALAAKLEIDDIIVAASHTHGSKDTMGVWGKDTAATGLDKEYNQFVVDQAVGALSESIDGLTNAHMTVGVSSATQLMRDSRLPEVRDDGIYTLHFTAANDDAQNIGTFVVWGNHAEAMGSGNTELTSDYPHWLRQEVEALLPGTTAIFAPGVLGGLTTPLGILMCPDETGTVDNCPVGNWLRPETIGRSVAQAAVASLSASDARVEKRPALGLRRIPLLLTPTNRPLALAFAIGLVRRPLYDAETGERMDEAVVEGLSIDDIPLALYQIDTELNAFSIGDVEVLTSPGELYAELWVTDPDGKPLIEKPENADFPDAEIEVPYASVMRDAKTKVLLNNANDSIGYIVPMPQWDMEQPHAYVPDGQYGEENSIGPLVAPELSRGVQALYDLNL
jgi:hypothetical protein